MKKNWSFGKVVLVSLIITSPLHYLCAKVMHMNKDMFAFTFCLLFVAIYSFLYGTYRDDEISILTKIGDKCLELRHGSK